MGDENLAGIDKDLLKADVVAMIESASDIGTDVVADLILLRVLTEVKGLLAARKGESDARSKGE